MRKAILAMIPFLLLSSCSKGGQSSSDEIIIPKDDYRNYYEIFVSSYADSNGDGIGDLNGIDQKLETLASIGYTGLWLTPIFKSNSYHKYDIIDYFSIDENFGSLDDLRKLIKDAHALNMKVLLDGVFNHSSSSNPWFLSSCKAYSKKINGEALSSEEEEFASLYSFVQKKEDFLPDRRYERALGFNFYCECNFSSDMPEFNFQSEKTYSLIQSVIDFYMSEEIKVDGFRLDATSYYDYKNTQENVKILSKIAKMIHDHDGYVVGECFESMETIRDYYTSGCDSFFYFPGYGKDGFYYNSLGFSGEYKKKYLDGLLMMNKIATDHIPAPFLDNHDTPRIPSAKNERQNKFLLGLRDMSNGAVFNYYGDEIGMTSTLLSSGDYVDSSYRTHYYWDDEEHSMECSDPPYSLEQVEYYPCFKKQSEDENSILSYEKKALFLRNKYPLIARGKIEVSSLQENFNSSSDDTLLLCFDKVYQDERIEFVFNFSSDTSYSYPLNGKKVLASLSVDRDEESEIKSDILSVKPYSISLLK